MTDADALYIEDEADIHKKGITEMIWKRVVIMLIGCLLITCRISTLAAADDIQNAELKGLFAIRDRMLVSYLTPLATDRVHQLRESLQEDGSWLDVDYSGTSTTIWEPVEHLDRLLTLTQAWFAPTAAEYGNAELFMEISLALDFWLHRDLRRPWWWDSIGAPERLSWILLMLDERLSESQRAKGIDILKRSQLDGTGQNLVWQAEITARRAILQKDSALLRRAFERIDSEIRISHGEGIQSDFSFHQHGPCLYNHGYGADFALYNARLAALRHDTPFALSAERLALLSAYILDGSQWLARGPYTDFGAEGREITRINQTAHYLGIVAQDMLQVPTGREAEFRALAARIAEEPEAEPLIGNRHFHRSDMMVHHRPNWYLSARMYSTRTLNTDSLSGCEEGLLSHYIADGANCIMLHGNEYLNLFPVWDWQRVPGTTVELAPHKPGEPHRMGVSAFAGGASDGTTGVAAFHLMRDSLRARKAWFFFSNGVVCLGADIHCASDHEVITTLNQCRLNGSVIVGGDTGVEVLDEGSHTLDVRWLWHDGVAYLLDEPTTIALANMPVTGNWQRISGQLSAHPVIEKVFLASLSHGVMPDGAAYAYAILQGTKAQDLPELTHSPPFQIVFNTASIQAVYHPGDEALGIVFHEAGQMEWQAWRLEVDRACVLVIRRVQDDWQLAIADPTAGTGAVKLEVVLPDSQTHGIDVALPEGLYAGASTIIRLEQELTDH